ncbi:MULTISPECIES: hypothetical protein [Emticicia]|uniref:hypothetical protein n=1 Tax=Emticicia TaxID=312278 RepID=UPI0007D8C1A0|nr:MULTISPECIES: hypothetical protein [Emticicia]
MSNLTTQAPLSNLQLELLKLYGSGVSDEDLAAINGLIVNYFAKKAQDSADKIWDEKKYSNDLMDEWLKADLRE